MNPKVAVLMCAHNAEPFIKEAIESILNQMYADFEFIIVENASTDKTWDIIKSYSDNRIKAFQSPIKQLSFNLNFGLMQTRAEYIARMDADDIAKPERLARQVQFLDTHPDIAVLGSAFELYGKSTNHKIISMPATDKAIRKKLPFRFCLCHPAVMFRRQIILENGGYQGTKFCQDVDLWLRLSRDKSVKFANLTESLLKYRIHPAQAKGTKESYIFTASYMFREAFLRRSIRFFAGSILALLKIIRTSN